MPVLRRNRNVFRVMTRLPLRCSHVRFRQNLRTFRCIGIGQLCAKRRPEQVQQNRSPIRSAEPELALPGSYRTGCPVGVRSETTPSFGVSTTLGRWIVKIDPWPGSLLTVMLPPII
jgi:hypothetical protein